MKMRKLCLLVLVMALALTMGIPSFAGEDEAPAQPVQEEMAEDEGSEEPLDNADAESPPDDTGILPGDVDAESPLGDTEILPDHVDAEDQSEDLDTLEPPEDAETEDEPNSEEEDPSPTIGSEPAPVPAPVRAPKRLMRAAAMVDVVVPASGNVLINPCRLPVNLDGKKSMDQVVSNTMYIRNRSSSVMSVTVEVEGAISSGSDIRLVSEPPDPDTTSKSLFLYAEFLPTSSDTVEPTWASSFTDADNQVLLRESYRRKRDFMELAPSGQAGSYCAMRLFGAAVMQPREPWTAADQVEISFTFTFEEV